MSISLAANSAATALPTTGSPDGVQASQSLFEHMAKTSGSIQPGAGPQELGVNLMERLNGFIERSRGFSERTERVANGAAPARTTDASAVEKSPTPTADTPNRVGDQQVNQLMQSLGKMFDYSIETQMVVRGATQVSGAANTLLKGQ
ncbi:hypothetical protein [Pseudomonas fluorescens]|jgi:hypothetical protein|uniref:hypothetical protein n=1 Tax=Pseudomonas fluorescens TaxID=294 RepID=UPI00381A653B